MSESKSHNNIAEQLSRKRISQEKVNISREHISDNIAHLKLSDHEKAIKLKPAVKKFPFESSVYSMYYSDSLVDNPKKEQITTSNACKLELPQVSKIELTCLSDKEFLEGQKNLEKSSKKLLEFYKSYQTPKIQEDLIESELNTRSDSIVRQPSEQLPPGSSQFTSASNVLQDDSKIKRRKAVGRKNGSRRYEICSNLSLCEDAIEIAGRQEQLYNPPFLDVISIRNKSGSRSESSVESYTTPKIITPRHYKCVTKKKDLPPSLQKGIFNWTPGFQDKAVMTIEALNNHKKSQALNSNVNKKIPKKRTLKKESLEEKRTIKDKGTKSVELRTDQKILLNTGINDKAVRKNSKKVAINKKGV